MATKERQERWRTMLAQAQRFADQDNLFEALERAKLVHTEATDAGDETIATQATHQIEIWQKDGQAQRKVIEARGKAEGDSELSRQT